MSEFSSKENLEPPLRGLEGGWFVAKRNGKQEYPWGVYRRVGGQSIRFNAFRTEIHARYYAAAQMIANPPSDAKRSDS